MIDASIPLQSQQPNLLNQIGQVQNLQAQRQNIASAGLAQQDQQLKLNADKQTSQDDADTRAAFAAGMKTDPTTGAMTFDRSAVLNTIGKLNPYKGAQMASQFATQDQAAETAKVALTKAQADGQKAQVQAAMAHVQGVSSILNDVTDQPSYTSAIQHGQDIGLVKPGELPEQWDPQLVKRWQSQALSQMDILNQHAKQQGYDLDAQKAAEVARHNQAAEGQTATYQTGELKQGQQRIGLEGAKLNLDRQKFAAESGGGSTPDGGSLVDAIGTGHIPLDRMSYLLAKNPSLVQSVVSKYPDFDVPKASTYSATYNDFTHGKSAQALNAGGTALGHLQELQQLNTLESRIPGTADHQRYENKVDTLSTELAKFYGDSTVSGIANIKKTLDSTFNRDAAIRTQAQSMGDKLDAFQQTWENAAPSKYYQAPMPGISPKALAAREALAGGGSKGGGSATPAPVSHAFSIGAWHKANPQGDLNAAKAAAQQAGYEVTQ